MILRQGLSRRGDADLVVMVARGDESAFGVLLERHQDVVYGFARRLLDDAQEAEDAAQETFLRFYQAAARYRPEASLRTYLLRITRNICIDHHRRKRPELMEDLPEMAGEETPLDLLERAVDAERLEAAVRTLPLNQREAILLRHTEQLGYAAIAEVMGLSVGAVESLLVRARRTLRRRLAAA